MKNYIFFFCTLFVSLLALTFSSCSEDEALTAETSSAITDNAELKTITFQVSAGSYGSSTRADEYETEHGEDDEYHNEDGFDSLTDYNYAYIYSTDNYYLGKITGLELKHNTNDDIAIYSCSGQTSIVLPSDFKVVFLGNYAKSTDVFPLLSEPGGEQGLLESFTEPTIGTTLDDLWTPISEGGLCPYFQPEYEPGKYGANSDWGIPYYGIHSYTDVILEEDEYNVLLDEPISLMRAIAKVEIIVNGVYDYDWGDGEPSLNAGMLHQQDLGYTMPKGVYSQDDYDDAKLNVYDNSNRSMIAGREPYITIDDNKTIHAEMYICEQDNHDADINTNNCTQIDFSINVGSAINYNYPNIYFGEYENGVCTAYDDTTQENMAKRWDVRRNHVYRFNVTFTYDGPIVESYDIDLSAPEWENHFENNSTTDLDTHD